MVESNHRHLTAIWKQGFSDDSSLDGELHKRNAITFAAIQLCPDIECFIVFISPIVKCINIIVFF